MEIKAKKSVMELKPYITAAQDKGIILNANEGPCSLFPLFKDEIIKRLEKKQLNRYPETDSNELLDRLSKYTGLSQENLICGNGSDELLNIITSCFISEGERVIVHSPTFSMYYIYSAIAGAKVIEVESRPDFSVDIDRIIKAANKNNAKLIFLCNPNNPTGNTISREDIIKTLENTEAVVVVDEAYYEFYGQSVMDLVEAYPQLIVLRTMSKAFALAGARIGYAGASKQVMELLMRVKPPYNLNSFSQIAACVYLENMDRINENIESIVRERKKLLDGLKDIREIKAYPSEANFILIESTYAGEILEKCKEEGIVLRGYSEPALKKFIRITAGQEDENKSVLKAIKRVVDRHD